MTTTEPSRSDPLARAARAVAEGNPGAADAFVLAAGPAVLSIARKILGTGHPEVEDVVQEALFAVLDALPRFRAECSVRHFVCRVAVLTAMNARRRLRVRELVTPDETLVENHAGEELSPVGHAQAARRRAALRRLLDELPPVQAEALALHCVLGYTVAETAAATGAPVNSVRDRLSTAKKALRNRLAAEPELFELVRGAS